MSKCPLHTSVIVSCRIHLCFFSSHHYSSLCHVFGLIHILLLPQNVHHILRIHLCLHSSLHPQHWWEPAFSPSFLSFVPPSLPPFLLPGSQLRCNHLPSPSLAAPLWVLGLAASASPAVCSLVLPLLCSPSQTQYSLPFGLRGGEVKHFKLQTQPGKQDSTPKIIYRLWKSECSLTSIDLFF